MALDRSVSRRRLLQLAGGATLAGALSACGGGNGSSSSGGPLKVIGAGSQEAGLRKALDDYKKAHSDFDFNLSFSPADQLQTALRAQLGGRQRPGPARGLPGQRQRDVDGPAEQGEPARRPERPGLDAEDPDRLQGRLPATTARPTSSRRAPACSARSTTRRRSRPPASSLPTTWSELLSVCDKLKKKGIVPIALGAQTPWVTQLINYALVPGTVYAKTPDFDDKMTAGSATFADSGWADAMDKYLELQKQRLLQRQPERHDVRAGHLDGRHRQGGDGRPGVRRPAGLPRGRRRRRTTWACSRSRPRTSPPTTGSPAASWSASRSARRARRPTQAQKFIEFLRPAGDRQRLGRGRRVRPAVLRGRAPRSTRC